MVSACDWSITQMPWNSSSSLTHKRRAHALDLPELLDIPVQPGAVERSALLGGEQVREGLVTLGGNPLPDDVHDELAVLDILRCAARAGEKEKGGGQDSAAHTLHEPIPSL